MATHLEPRNDLWSDEDLLALPQSACREEVLEGAMIVNPPPASPHQMLSSELWVVLRAAAPPGFTVIDAVGVRLPENTLLIPDLAVIRRPRQEARAINVHQAADVALAIEIVSPGSRVLDRLTKPALYARAGIPNYWRVELEDGAQVVAYRLDGDVYAEVATTRPGESLDLDEPFPISFDPAVLAT